MLYYCFPNTPTPTTTIFLPNLVFQYKPASQFSSMTATQQGSWWLTQTSDETHEAILGTRQCNTIGEKRFYLPSSKYMSSEVPTTSKCPCDWQWNESNTILPTRRVSLRWLPCLPANDGSGIVGINSPDVKHFSVDLALLSYHNLGSLHRINM